MRLKVLSDSPRLEPEALASLRRYSMRLLQPSSGLRESCLGVFKATVKVVVAMSRVLRAKLRILGPNVKALETKALASLSRF